MDKSDIEMNVHIDRQRCRLRLLSELRHGLSRVVEVGSGGARHIIHVVC